MKIALVVDNPYRDLPGVTLLARELASRGATCFLIPYNLLESELWALAPDFVLLNFVRRANESLIERLSSYGIIVGILDTEGSVFVPVPKEALDDIETAEHIGDKTAKTINTYMITIARKAEARAKVDCYLAWSENVKSFLIENRLFSPDQLHVTGAPRSDLLTPGFRTAVKAMSTYADEFRPPLVLINASSPVANPAFFTAEEEMEMMIKMFHYKREYVQGLAHAQAQGLRGMTRLANDLAHSFPDVNFVLRPHPFERLSVYKFLLDDLPNLCVRKQGTVEGWLSRASCLVQLGSSTAVEAAAFGIPCLTPGWLPVHMPVPVSDLASETLPTVELLKQKLSEVLAGTYVISAEKMKDRRTAIDMAHDGADGCAHIRCADVILQTINKRPNRACRVLSNCRYQAYTSKLKGPRWRRWLHARSSQLLGRGVHWSWPKFKNLHQTNLPWDKSEKRFDPEQIKVMIQALDQVKPPLKEELIIEAADSYYHSGYREGRAVVVRPRS